jgi:PAS domain S-box-containing protein
MNGISFEEASETGVNRAIFEMAFDGMLIVDDSKRIIDANRAVCSILGYTPEELSRLQINEIVAPERRDEFPALWQRFMTEGTLEGGFPLRRKDGKIIEVEYRSVARFQPDRHLCVLHDITSRNSAEAALTCSEERFAAFMDYLPGYAWIKDRDGVYIYGNPALEQMPNLKDGFLGKKDTDLWSPEIAELYLANDRNVIANKRAISIVEPHVMDGRKRYVIATKFPIFDGAGEVAMVGGACVDITERIETEAALAESENRHRQLVQALPIAVYTCDAQGRITFYNRAAAKLWGRSPEIGKELWCGAWRMYESDGQPLTADRCSMAVAIADGQSVPGRAIVLERPDGSRSFVLPHPAPIRDAAGTVIGGVNMVLDLTERRAAEERICESEARLAEAVALAHLGHWERDLSTDQVTWPDERYRMIGLQPGECDVSYASFLKSVHPEDRERVQRAIGVMVRDKLPASYSYRVILPGGSVRVHDTRATVITDSGGRAIRVFGVTQDITEMRETAEALRQANEQLHVFSQRLFQVQEGERRHLARELHDQIGQAVTAVKIGLQGAMELEDPSGIAPRLEAAITLLDDLTQRVRTLSLRLRPPLLDDLGLVSALRSYLDSQAQLGGFFLEFYADPTLGRLPAGIETACFRIVQEAVTNILRHADADRVNVSLHRIPEALHVIVRDNGIGFDAIANQEHLDGGTGLGLLGMRERVGLLGGEIDFRSKRGDGVEIHAFLPIRP